MPKTRQQKEDVIKKLTEDLSGAKGATLTTFSKLPVKLDQKLRHNLYSEKVSYAVVKKTLLQRVFDSINCREVNIEELKGNVAVAASKEDEVISAKILSKFSKENEQVILVGGFLDGQWINGEGVVSLANLPGKQDLLGQVVRVFKSPINGFVNVLAGNMRGLVNVLNAIKDKKEV